MEIYLEKIVYRLNRLKTQFNIHSTPKIITEKSSKESVVKLKEIFFEKFWCIWNKQNKKTKTKHSKNVKKKTIDFPSGYFLERMMNRFSMKVVLDL